MVEPGKLREKLRRPRVRKKEEEEKKVPVKKSRRGKRQCKKLLREATPYVGSVDVTEAYKEMQAILGRK